MAIFCSSVALHTTITSAATYCNATHEVAPSREQLDAPFRITYRRDINAIAEQEKIPMPSKILDARYLNCPLPILKTKRALDSVEIGEILEVLATDPASPIDFTAFAHSTGHTLLEQSKDEDGVFRFLLRREA